MAFTQDIPQGGNQCRPRLGPRHRACPVWVLHSPYGRMMDSPRAANTARRDVRLSYGGDHEFSGAWRRRTYSSVRSTPVHAAVDQVDGGHAANAHCTVRTDQSVSVHVLHLCTSHLVSQHYSPVASCALTAPRSEHRARAHPYRFPSRISHLCPGDRGIEAGGG